MAVIARCFGPRWRALVLVGVAGACSAPAAPRVDAGVPLDGGEADALPLDAAVADAALLDAAVADAALLDAALPDAAVADAALPDAALPDAALPDAGCPTTCDQAFAAQPLAPVAIALDATHAYWGVDDAIRRKPKLGGAIETLATGQGGVYDVALDDAFVYWVAWRDQVVRRRAKAGGAVETVATGQPGAVAIAVDATHVYWSVDGEVRRRAKSGGAIETLAAAQDGVFRIVVDGTYAYWIAANDETVVRCPKAGGPTEVLASGQPYLDDLAVDATHVYWTARQLDPARNQVRRRAKAGGAVEAIVSELIFVGQGPYTDLVRDGAYVYWVASNQLPSHTIGRLQRAVTTGGPVESLISSADFPGHLALDAADLYWTHPAGIDRMARCACGF